MKIRQGFAAILAAAFILSGSFPVFAAEPDLTAEEIITKETFTEPDNIEEDEEEAIDESTLSETADAPENETDSITENKTDTDAKNEMDFVTENEADSVAEDEMSNISQPETISIMEEEPDETDFPVPDKTPAFYAHIEYWMGYTVIGTFTDFTPDIIQIQTLYSQDGENWQIGTEDWNLFNLNTDDENKLYALQNQPCLFNVHEPLKSYIAGKTDRFYLKLRITKKNGLSYETMPAVIERGSLQAVPEGTEHRAQFASAISVLEPVPDTSAVYRKYGQYQLTVSADATSEEVSALLPDTLPVEVQLDNGADFIAIGVVDCPVTWKPLSLPHLSAGESITIADAAEEILVPAGTVISTPLGLFQLDEPLGLNTSPSTDEVRLVLNVSPEDGTPTGVLRVGKNGLEIAFHNKPTGALSIQAYVLAEGETNWTELPELSLSDILNQSSSANSGYTLILSDDQEPYRSYLASTDDEEFSTPFYVRLKIEGGIYDGKQLTLAWPNIYEQLPTLPEVGGAGGNEINAGADNKDDSTESGQRPNLPQISDNDPEKQQLDPGPSPDGSHKGQQKTLTSDSDGQKPQIQPPPSPETASVIPKNQDVPPTDKSGSEYQENQSVPSQRPNQPGTVQNTTDTAAVNQEYSLKSVPFGVQDITDIKDAGGSQTLSDAKASVNLTTKSSSRLPLLPLATVIAAGGCISAVFFKATGYGLLRHIMGKIRNILSK